VAHLPHDPGLCHADPMTVQAARGGRRVGAPGLVVRLLGRPGIERRGDEPYRLRSRKSWALLTYLLLTEHPHSRGRLAELLFAEADDPLRALRWSLAEIRRALADHGSVEGDPVVLTLADDVLVDVVELSHGSWVEAMEVAGAGGELLDGPVLRGAPAFESWLLSERRRLASATESVLHEAALGLLARGELDRARGFAVRAAAMSPLDENHQALVIRLYRLCGDDDAAERQYRAFAALLDAELGVDPGTAVEAARHERPRAAVEATTDRAVEAVIEAGSAAIAAGATDPGIASLRSAVPLADATGATPLRVSSRLALAEALIHSVRGQDEEGQAHLHEADRLALLDGDLSTVAQARAELGYVDFLRARYDRAEKWLTDAIDLAQGSPQVLAKATTYLGSVHSDRGSYPQAVALLDEGARLARRDDDPRREAYALSMRGRVDLLRGNLDDAADRLAESVTLAERGHWLSFLPWPEALQGEVHLARHEPDLAAQTLERAFARACHLGDPCWEGISARGLALVAEAAGRTGEAFDTLLDARTRSTRLADPYVWLHVHILDALCTLGVIHAHPETAHWVATMRELASRTGMRELTVRALLHSAALGDAGDAAAAALLATEVDNDELATLLR
jgi:DNA-binding SARP family transcriptional activator